MNGTTLIIILILTSLFPLAQAELATAIEIDVTGFGEARYRSTNLYEAHYDFAGGRAEARIAARNLIAYKELIGMTPFAKGVLSWTNHMELPEENTLDMGWPRGSTSTKVRLQIGRVPFGLRFRFSGSLGQEMHRYCTNELHQTSGWLGFHLQNLCLRNQGEPPGAR